MRLMITRIRARIMDVVQLLLTIKRAGSELIHTKYQHLTEIFISHMRKSSYIELA